MTKQVDGEQALPDMPDAPGRPTHISFIGMGTESHAAGVFKFGAELEFKVKVRVALGPTPEEMADGHVRDLVKARVLSVEPLSYDEPQPVQVISGNGDRDDIGND